jgi:hypothetical protein
VFKVFLCVVDEGSKNQIKMYKLAILALVVVLASVACAQILLGSPAYGLNGPNFHGPFASSATTGIRRYGSTAGFLAAAPIGAYYI